MENKVIFWDFDGTLVYKNQSFFDSLTVAIADAGYEIQETACRDFLHLACSWNHPQDSYEGRTGELWWEDLLAKTEKFLLEQAVPADSCRSISEAFRKNAVSYAYRLYDDGEEILACARSKGYRSYILSNNFPELTQTINRLGLQNYFKDVFLSSELGFEKPRSELFREALWRAGNPEQVYMVGDNPQADIAGAGSVGITTIYVHPEGQTPCGDFTCETLSEIKEIL